MAERLSRKELYDLVWSESLRTLSSRFGISDVALKKTCARAQIPTPDRGYWAKKDVGKPTFQPELPIRPPGMDDQVLIAAGQSYWYQDWEKEELLGPLPPPPEFPEPIEAVRERIAKFIGKVTVLREVRVWHPAIDRLLKEVETRREKQRGSLYLCAFYAMFPGNGKFNVFPMWLSEERHARLSSVFAPHIGHPHSEDLDAEYLNVFETRTRTPFFQDVYVDGVRVMLIIGPTGSGKSVIGNATVALEQKYGGFTYIFDIGGSYLDDLRIGLTLLLRDRSGVNIKCRSDVRVPQ